MPSHAASHAIRPRFARRLSAQAEGARGGFTWKSASKIVGLMAVFTTAGGVTVSTWGGGGEGDFRNAKLAREISEMKGELGGIHEQLGSIDKSQRQQAEATQRIWERLSQGR